MNRLPADSGTSPIIRECVTGALRDVPVEIYGGAMVILENNSLPSNIKKKKLSPLQQ